MLGKGKNLKFNSMCMYACVRVCVYVYMPWHKYSQRTTLWNLFSPLPLPVLCGLNSRH